MTRAATAYQSAATSPPTSVRLVAVPVIAACLPPVLWWDVPQRHDS